MSFFDIYYDNNTNLLKNDNFQLMTINLLVEYLGRNYYRNPSFKGVRRCLWLFGSLVFGRGN